MKLILRTYLLSLSHRKQKRAYQQPGILIFIPQPYLLYLHTKEPINSINLFVIKLKKKRYVLDVTLIPSPNHQFSDTNSFLT